MYRCTLCGGTDGHNARICVSHAGERRDRALEEQRAAKAAARERLGALGLTPEVARVIYARIRTRKAFHRLADFVREAWPVIEPGINPERDWNWHLDAICDHVQWMLEGWLLRTGHAGARWIADDSPSRAMHARGEYAQNLLINFAPATLKSKITMVFAPAWMWLRAPGWTVACLSGNPDNVTRDSNACRELVTSPWYRDTFAKLPDGKPCDVAAKAPAMNPAIDAVGKWRLSAGGERTSRGLQASGVGLHVDAVFLDDPDDWVKVHGEAARLEVRRQWEAYGNRVNSLRDSIRIVVQQRVHVDDLSASVLSTGDYVHFYAAVEFDPRQRCRTPWGWVDPRTAKGENMHAARFDEVTLAKERRRLGPQGFEAQYNQRPESLEGGMFKREWIRFYTRDATATPLLERPPGCRSREELPARELPKLTTIALTLDGTFGSVTATASRVGLLAIGIHGPDRYVLADRTRRMDGSHTMAAAVIDLLEEYPQAKTVLVEKKALGAAVIERLEESIRAGKCRAVKVIPIDTGSDSKPSRAYAMQPDVAEGHLFVEDGAEWVTNGLDSDDAGGFVGELCSFPGGKKDDRVDSLSQFFRHYAVHKSQARLQALLNASKVLR